MKTAKQMTDELWERYREQRDITTRNELLNQYVYLLRIHAARLGRRLPRQVTLAEIMSAAFDGLLDAVESFDPDRKIKFETYAGKRIVGAVHDWLRSTDPLSRSIRDFQKRRDEAVTLASSDAGHAACDAEVADRMGLAEQRYETYMLRSRWSSPVSTSGSDQEDGDGSGVQLQDFPDKRQASPDSGVRRRMAQSFLVNGLNEQERRVLMLYYYEELTMAQVGSILGLSESRVSQVHKSVLEQLRTRFGTMRNARAVI